MQFKMRFSLEVYSSFVNFEVCRLHIFFYGFFFSTTHPFLVERHFSCKCNHRTMKAAYNNCPALSDIAPCCRCLATPNLPQAATSPFVAPLWQPLRASIFALAPRLGLCECNRIRTRPAGSITIFSLYIFLLPLLVNSFEGAAQSATVFVDFRVGGHNRNHK